MRLITRQTCANEAAKRWEEQYPDSRKDVRRELLALGVSPDPGAVDEIIGNNSWTEPPVCSECAGEGVPVLEVGQIPDDDSYTAYLCKACASKAMDLFEQ